VPDHQEVYLDRNGLTSIIFDILARVDEDDQSALKYHLEDITSGDKDGSSKIWSTSTASLTKLP
jgi:hypothetical protein